MKEKDFTISISKESYADLKPISHWLRTNYLYGSDYRAIWITTESVSRLSITTQNPELLVTLALTWK